MRKMKNLLFLSMLFLGGLAFTSCSSSAETEVENTEQAQNQVYYCPMYCEEGKVYDAEGTCPVCGMDLVLEEAES